MEEMQLKNRLRQIRVEKNLSQGMLAEMVGVSRNTISSVETGQYCPTAKLAYLLSIALDMTFEELFYFEEYEPRAKRTEEGLGASLSDKAIRRIREYAEEHGWSAEQVLELILYVTR